MNNRRIFIGLQHFADGEGDGGIDANALDNQTADNGGDAQDSKPTYDDKEALIGSILMLPDGRMLRI